MSMLNSLLCRLFDALLFPFSGLHPLVGLAVVSLVFGVVMLLVFKVTSNQEKLTAVKRRIHAGLFEIRLFNDDLRAISRALADILRHNLSYIGLAMVPLLWMMAPIVLVIAQLQFHYGYQGLKPGQPTLVKVALTPNWNKSLGGDARPEFQLQAPAGLEIEAGPTWAPALRELTWRLSASEPGDYELSLVSSTATLTKSVVVSDKILRRSPSRLSPGFVNQLLYPAESPLPETSPVHSITLGYPEGNAGFEGWENEWTWMIFFLILSIVFAFALRKPLKVTI